MPTITVYTKIISYSILNLTFFETYFFNIKTGKNRGLSKKAILKTFHLTIILLKNKK